MAPLLRVHAVTVVRDRLGRPAVLVADAHRSQCRSVDAEDLVVGERGEATERSAERLAPSKFAVPFNSFNALFIVNTLYGYV